MIVLDANAAIAIALGTTDGTALEMLQDPGELIIAPALLHSEVAHAMVKYVRGGYLETDQTLAVARDAVALVDEYRDDALLMTEAMTESIRLEHSSYDLFYLILARREGATLFTLDRRLQELCENNGVSTLWVNGEF